MDSIWYEIENAFPGGNILGLSFSKIFTLECFIIICMQHSFICLGGRLSMELGTEHTIINISFYAHSPHFHFTFIRDVDLFLR